MISLFRSLRTENWENKRIEVSHLLPLTPLENEEYKSSNWSPCEYCLWVLSIDLTALAYMTKSKCSPRSGTPGSPDSRRRRTRHRRLARATTRGRRGTSEKNYSPGFYKKKEISVETGIKIDTFLNVNWAKLCEINVLVLRFYHFKITHLKSGKGAVTELEVGLRGALACLYLNKIFPKRKKKIIFGYVFILILSAFSVFANWLSFISIVKKKSYRCAPTNTVFGFQKSNGKWYLFFCSDMFHVYLIIFSRATLSITLKGYGKEN